MFRYGESAAPLLTKKKHEMHVTLKYKAPKLPKKMGAFKPSDACIKALQNFFSYTVISFQCCASLNQGCH